MDEHRKIKSLEYEAKLGENIKDFIIFLTTKFEKNKVKKVVGIHNYKITIEEIEDG